MRFKRLGLDDLLFFPCNITLILDENLDLFGNLWRKLWLHARKIPACDARATEDLGQRILTGESRL